MTKLFFKFKKTIFGPFSQFLEQKRFFQKIWLFHAQQFLPPSQNSEKPNDSIPRKHHRAGRTEGWTDTILYDHSIPATAGSPTSTTAIDWLLKVI